MVLPNYPKKWDVINIEKPRNVRFDEGNDCARGIWHQYSVILHRVEELKHQKHLQTHLRNCWVIEVTRWSLEKIIFKAVRNSKGNNFKKWFRDKRDGYSSTGTRSKSEAIKKASVNFIRHCLSNHKKLLNRLKRRNGNDKSHFVLKTLVLDRISEVYPELQDECIRQKMIAEDKCKIAMLKDQSMLWDNEGLSMSNFEKARIGLANNFSNRRSSEMNTQCSIHRFTRVESYELELPCQCGEEDLAGIMIADVVQEIEESGYYDECIFQIENTRVISRDTKVRNTDVFCDECFVVNSRIDGDLDTTCQPYEVDEFDHEYTEEEKDE